MTRPVRASVRKMRKSPGPDARPRLVAEADVPEQDPGGQDGAEGGEGDRPEHLERHLAGDEVPGPDDAGEEEEPVRLVLVELAFRLAHRATLPEVAGSSRPDRRRMRGCRGRSRKARRPRHATRGASEVEWIPRLLLLLRRLLLRHRPSPPPVSARVGPRAAHLWPDARGGVTGCQGENATGSGCGRRCPLRVVCQPMRRGPRRPVAGEPAAALTRREAG